MPRKTPEQIARDRIHEAETNGSTDLDLSDLGLSSAPKILLQLVQLRSLDLSNNQLTSIPESLGQLAQLRSLDLSSNQLTSIPESLGQLAQLHSLNLTNNQLTSIPESLGQLAQLRSLDLFINALTSIPESLGNLAQLQALHLSANQLTSIPESLGQLAQLRSLDLSNNEFTSIPESLGQLAQLQSLYLYENQLTSIPDFLSQLAQLQTLHLSGNQLTSIPESLGQLAQLQALDLSRNRLTSIPECIGNLAQLQSLYLYENQLTSIPDFLSQFAQLQVLQLSDNQLTCLPESLGNLAQLKSLYLFSNKLTSIPDFLSQLAQLQILYLSNNQFTSLPESLGKLTQLHTLRLYGNQLTSLPESLGEITQLQVLHLSDNQLTSLPESLRHLPQLKELYLHDNSGLLVPPEILGPTWSEVLKSDEKIKPASPAAILDYYFRTRGGSRPLNEIKLILVGRGDVGKTSLVNRLVHNSFTPQEKTEGIQISHLPLTCASDQIHANVWDFGGQEIMHGTHQFFLTERSLYLLVLNGRGGGEDADVEYWLKLIASFGGDSPVIVVLNKINEHRFDLNRSALRGKYPAIRDFVETDCESGKGIETLRQTITHETGRLEHVRTPFPANWFKIKERLSTTTEDFISFERFREICYKLGEKDEVAQDFLAGHLHNLGIALNYKDDPRLRDTSVLNPHWVTIGIYKLLNTQILSEQRGELCLSQLGNLLPKKHYPESKHLFLIELMRKFELCFPLDNGGSERYLVPELLGKQEPEELEAEFPPEICLNFEYHYNPILPEGLLPRFIVRTYALSAPTQRWRSGTVLSFDDCNAVVKGDIQDRRVVVRVNGPAPKRRTLLAIIRSHFDSIHRDFKKLDPVAKVPVPGHPKALVDYDELLLYEKERETHIKLRIGDSLKKFEVSPLLEGIDLPKPAHTRRRHTSTMELRPLRLFYSYSHKDERLRDELQTHLTLLQLEGLIEPWHDRRILPGEEWDHQISHNLEQADIILLLVSPDFNASKYCRDIEVKRAMERHEEGTAKVIPIALRPCDWKTTPFAKLQGLPRDMKIIDGPRSRRDKLWTEVANSLRAVLKEMQAR